MALQLNLLREEQQIEIERRRDPLKLGMLGVLLIVLCMAGFYLMRMGEVSKLKSKRASLEMAWQNLQPRFEEAKVREVELQEMKARADALRALMNRRFLWGTFLADLTNMVPASASLTSFSGSVQNSKLRCSLSGNIAGENPRRLAEEFRTAISRLLNDRFQDVEVAFQSLEDDTTPYIIRGQKTSGAKFSLSVEANISKSDEEVTEEGNAS